MEAIKLPKMLDVAQLCCRISLHSLISWKPKERTWHALPPAPAATPCLALFGQIWIPAISFAQPCHGHHVMIVSRSLDTDRHFGWSGVSSLAWAQGIGVSLHGLWNLWICYTWAPENSTSFTSQHLPLLALEPSCAALPAKREWLDNIVLKILVLKESFIWKVWKYQFKKNRK